MAEGQADNAQVGGPDGNVSGQTNAQITSKGEKKGKTKKIPVEHDTRSNQKFTKEKLATMRPGDIAAVASQRGYDVDDKTGRIGHASFLKQQEDGDGYEGDDDYTESGTVPEDYQNVQDPNRSSGAMPSVHGGVGGLPPVAPAKVDDAGKANNEALGEQSSEEDHTGKTEGDFTMGAIVEPKKADEPGSTDKPLFNVPVEGQKA